MSSAPVTVEDRLRRAESRLAQLEDWRARIDQPTRRPLNVKPTREQIVFALVVASILVQLVAVVADLRRAKR